MYANKKEAFNPNISPKKRAGFKNLEFLFFTISLILIAA